MKFYMEKVGNNVLMNVEGEIAELLQSFYLAMQNNPSLSAALIGAMSKYAYKNNLSFSMKNNATGEDIPKYEDFKNDIENG